MVARFAGVVFAAAVFAVLAVSFGVVAARLHPLADVFAQFLLPAIVGAAFVIGGALVFGRHGVAGAGLAALALCVVLALPWQLAPSTSGTASAGSPRIKLLLFNILYKNPNLPAVERFVRDTGADIVVLLEVTHRNRPALRGLDALYPHRLECWQRAGCDVLILSRTPLADLAPALAKVSGGPSLAGASLDLGGCRTSLIATHLTLPFPFQRVWRQRRQVDALLESVRDAPVPRIVVGDFNAAAWGGVVARIADRLGLTVLTGFGGTWPTRLPAVLGIPIDHVMASPEIALLSREIKTVPGSDHRGVLAELAPRACPPSR